MTTFEEKDLEKLFADPFVNAGPLVFGAVSIGCKLTSHDTLGESGLTELTAGEVKVSCATLALGSPGPEKGNTITVAGTSYRVRQRQDLDYGITWLWVTPTP